MSRKHEVVTKLNDIEEKIDSNTALNIEKEDCVKDLKEGMTSNKATYESSFDEIDIEFESCPGHNRRARWRGIIESLRMRKETKNCVQSGKRKCWDETVRPQSQGFKYCKRGEKDLEYQITEILVNDL
ncbi:hypothetical protein Tco_1376426 [Tanacetum coccineum]